MSEPRRPAADEETFIRRVVHDHQKTMLTYARDLTGDRSAAEDVVQEALLRTWRWRGELIADKVPLKAWLITVVRNIVYDSHRARRRRPWESGEPSETDLVERDHADRVVSAIVVGDELRRLPATHRTVLEMRYLWGDSVQDTADTLGIAPGTVKSRTHYGLQVLRETYGH